MWAHLHLTASDALWWCRPSSLHMVFDRKNKRKEQVPVIPGARKTLIIGGICCGVALCLASNFQQFGIQYTTVGKAGFITACYIVIVPVLGLLLGKKCSPVWLPGQ